LAAVVVLPEPLTPPAAPPPGGAIELIGGVGPAGEQLAAQGLLQVLRMTSLRSSTRLPQCLGHVFGGLNTQVGLHQNGFQFIPGFIVISVAPNSVAMRPKAALLVRSKPLFSIC
jgi:hypothetical protein